MDCSSFGSNSSSVAEVIQLLLLYSSFIYKSAIVPADDFQLPAHRQALNVTGKFSFHNIILTDKTWRFQVFTFFRNHFTADRLRVFG
jgi:hypothetical protein